ncbi:styrene monooxygenase NADH-dependent flavin reductase subunit StyB [Rhodococcus koreensis]
MTSAADAPPAPEVVPAPVEVAADAKQFRSSVALFATGIAVVTMQDGDGNVHGATINSFTSISLDPPTVMISLKPGYAHELISKSGWYGVSVLSKSQQEHSRYFAGSRDNDWHPQFVTGENVPTLFGSLARFECKVFDTIIVNDHTLFLARVARCESEDGSPLMFFASTYHQPVLGAS